MWDTGSSGDAPVDGACPLLSPVRHRPIPLWQLVSPLQTLARYARCCFAQPPGWDVRLGLFGPRERDYDERYRLSLRSKAMTDTKRLPLRVSPETKVTLPFDASDYLSSFSERAQLNRRLPTTNIKYVVIAFV